MLLKHVGCHLCSLCDHPRSKAHLKKIKKKKKTLFLVIFFNLPMKRKKSPPLLTVSLKCKSCSPEFTSCNSCFSSQEQLQGTAAVAQIDFRSPEGRSLAVTALPGQPALSKYPRHTPCCSTKRPTKAPPFRSEESEHQGQHTHTHRRTLPGMRTAFTSGL